MAQVQTNTESGEMSQRFIEFVMMQAQNAALFMGQAPAGEGPEINLDLAKMFIDQLGMIREKTRGNLTEEELKVLNGVISGLQMTFVEASQKKGLDAAGPASPPPEAERPPAAPASPPAPEEEGRKKFTKSYGA